MNTGKKLKLLLLPAILSFFTFSLPVLANSNLTPSYNQLFLWVTILSFLVLALVLVLFVYFTYRFRENNETEREPLSHVNSRRLEITWTIVAALIVIFLLAFSFPVIFDNTNVAEAEDGDGEYYIVEGTNSWTWYYYEINDTGHEVLIASPQQGEDNAFYTNFTLQVDQKYTFEFRSGGAYIHSYYVPGLNIKMDVIPGESNYYTFTPTETGEYVLQCAEFCGFGHSNMRGYLIVE